jgi:hypothetical protein
MLSCRRVAPTAQTCCYHHRCQRIVRPSLRQGVTAHLAPRLFPVRSTSYNITSTSHDFQMMLFVPSSDTGHATAYLPQYTGTGTSVATKVHSIKTTQSDTTVAGRTSTELSDRVAGGCGIGHRSDDRCHSHITRRVMSTHIPAARLELISERAF